MTFSVEQVGGAMTPGEQVIRAMSSTEEEDRATSEVFLGGIPTFEVDPLVDRWWGVALVGSGAPLQKYPEETQAVVPFPCGSNPVSFPLLLPHQVILLQESFLNGENILTIQGTV